MSLLLLILFIGGSLASTTRLHKVYYDPDEAEVHFEKFIRTFSRQYLDEYEKEMRFEAFKENLKEINYLNSINPRAVYGITKIADYTAEEKAQYGCLLNMNKTKTCQERNWDTTSINAPDSFDWRDKNVISPAKNQGGCGSCWAFSAVGKHREETYTWSMKDTRAYLKSDNPHLARDYGSNTLMARVADMILMNSALESHYAIKYGKMMSFSEQQLVDCDKEGTCSGGYISGAFGTMMALGGIMTEADYSYKESKNACRFDVNKVAAKITGCNEYPTKDEEVLKNILYSKGPIAFGFDSKCLNHYTGGIIESCANGPVDGHAVVFVGYGLENGEPFWIVKNSFGPDWGEKGYFRIRRGSDVCGIMDQEKITPIVA